jgi:hypothetical protein
VNGNEKGEWYRGGHGGQTRKAGDRTELTSQGCINLIRPSCIIAAGTQKKSNGRLTQRKTLSGTCSDLSYKRNGIHITVDEASPTKCY